MNRHRFCGEIMAPFLQVAANRQDLAPIQIIGGNGSAALGHEATVIDLANKTIRTPACCDLSSYRPDGSLRDMDVLVLSSNQAEVDRVHSLAQNLIGDDLGLSIFGLKDIAALELQRTKPIRSSALVFLGDRYFASTTDDQGRAAYDDGFKAIYPFKAPISVETLETFQLSIGDLDPIPTSHPGATILSYLTRSISGLRAKDAEKVDRIVQQVASKSSEILGWIHEGPGSETLDLARILQTLSEPRNNPQTLHIGGAIHIEPYDLNELTNHQSFMASHLHHRAQRALLEIAHAKSRVVRRYEANPAIVTFWQKHIEERLHRIVHNS